MYLVYPTKLKDCYELEMFRFGDPRGYFSSSTKSDWKRINFKRFSQVSESKSEKGVLRGMHFQKEPYAQAKIVSVVSGSALDVVVDCRPDSPTYGQYLAVELNSDERNMLYVPRGFAHGFLSLEDNTVFQYMVDNEYAPNFEDGIAYDDPKVKIPWDTIKRVYGIDEFKLSPKDSNRHGIDEIDTEFSFKPKKFLITGASGQLGHDVVEALEQRGEYHILALSSQDMDLTDRDRVMEVVKDYKPDVIIHCAAYTKVDVAETDYKQAYLVNCQGTKNITDASIKVGAKIIYTSTDYVFDGTKDGLYNEEDKVNPRSVYGSSKYDGELEVAKNPKHFISRISWVHGAHGNNFVKTMINVGKTHDKVRIVEDQIGGPSYTVDIAKILVEMTGSNKYGTYHVANTGYASKADLMEYVYKKLGMNVEIERVTTQQFYEGSTKVVAERPLNSRFDLTKLAAAGFSIMPSWQSGVDRLLEEWRKSNNLQDKELVRVRKSGK